MSDKGYKVLLKEVEKQTKTNIIDALEVGDEIIVVMFDRTTKRHVDLLNTLLLHKQVIIVEKSDVVPNLQTCAVKWLCKQQGWVA